jgi:hypothetical protein
MAVERPDRMRVEVLGLFSQLAALLVSKDGRYQLYEAGQEEWEEGPVTADLLWRVARIDLTPNDAVAILLGAPHIGAELSPGTSRWDQDAFLSIDLIDEQRRLRERVVFDASGELRELTRFDTIGALVWQARFDDHRPLEGGDGGVRNFAHRVELDFPNQRASALLTFQAVELDPDLDAALFELSWSRDDRAGDALQ